MNLLVIVMIILVKNCLESLSSNKVLRTTFGGYYECINVSIEGIGRFIRKVYKKHYWKFKFLPPQVSEATYTPGFCWKDQIILATGRGHFGRFLGFSDFSKGSPLWNEENKSCLNDIKFCEVSGNPKTSKFWKLQLSISCGTQKSAKMPRPVAKMIWSF